MKYYLIAGEASGDLHGSNLIKALRALDQNAEFRAWGGDLMQAAGAHLVKHYRDLAFMGFAEVVRNLPTILGNLKFCKQDIASFQPDVVVFIDYPGFNLRLAPYVKSLGIKSVYYISPQLWAWKPGRVKIIHEHIDQMLCILPFEKAWFAQHQVVAHDVGHPLLDALADYPFDPDFRAAHGLDERPILALLPGSRKQEIAKKLPVMLKAAAQFPQCQVVVAAAPGQPVSFYEEIAQGQPMRAISGVTYQLLHTADAAMVTSGTATLETALIGCPELVAYKSSFLSYEIGKRLVKVPYISLVNLILNRKLVQEFIQNDCTPANLADETRLLLENEEYRTQIKAGYAELREKLGGAGASNRAAEKIFTILSDK